MGLSSFASRSVEDVCAVHDKVFFQVYWAGSKEDILERAPCVRGGGRAKGLIVTLDWTFATRRDWAARPSRRRSTSRSRAAVRARDDHQAALPAGLGRSPGGSRT